MSRGITNKLYRTFVKGLITESSPLTYPENASLAEDNCVIFIKGNRSRRLGLDFEQDYVYNSSTSIAAIHDVAFNEYRWNSVDNDSTRNYLCVQIGSKLHFWNADAVPLSGGKLPYIVDLNSFRVPLAGDLSSTDISMAGGKGYLFVCGGKIEPFYIAYNPDTDYINVHRINILMRDFLGVDDGYANDYEPTTLTDLHKYNLMNQGWVTPENDGSGTTTTYYGPFGTFGTYASPGTAPIDSYHTAHSRYPGNNKQWWIAQATSDHDGLTTGDFDPNLLNKFFYGNTHAPRGHFILEAFNKDRAGVSGIAGIPADIISERPLSVAFFAGRVWYLCNNTIYYSQILDETPAKAGFCYQEADPTAQSISDLIATDGGVIPIPEMATGNRLMPYGAGIIVFATNGIWHVSGGGGGFTATDVSVSKLNSIGTTSPRSIVETDGVIPQIFWFSDIGIQGMQQQVGSFGPVEGRFQRTNVTQETIHSFYMDDIPFEKKKYVKGVFDAATNMIQWLFSSDASLGANEFDRILNYDLTLSAFYPWSISPSEPKLCGVFTTPDINRLEEETTIRSNFLKYLTMVPVNGSWIATFGHFHNFNFADWQAFDGVGVAYNSFMETGYEILEDAMRKKEANYVFLYFNRTEKNFVLNESTGNYEPDRPSSCYFQAKWEWSNSSVSNKYSPKMQGYRLSRTPLVNEDDLTFDTGFPVVISKNKVRGNGRALQLRFENNSIGSNFDILGWAVNYSGFTVP